MSGVSLTADYKDAGSSRTMESLRAALDDMEAHGVPHYARLRVSAYATGGWEIRATWTPDPAVPPVPPVPPVPTGVVVNVHPGLEENAGAIAERFQRDTRGVRRIKDNPQDNPQA